MDVRKLPLGIRLNNPGLLRGYTNMDYHRPYEKGFAHFDSMYDGWFSMLSLMHDMYERRKLRTYKLFVSFYAPPNENDVQAYIKALMHIRGTDKVETEDSDLCLRSIASAVTLAQAISIVENGRPPKDWPDYPEWDTCERLLLIAKATGRWAL